METVENYLRKGEAIEAKDTTERSLYFLGWVYLKTKMTVFNVGKTEAADPLRRWRHRKVLTQDGRDFETLRYQKIFKCRKF